MIGRGVAYRKTDETDLLSLLGKRLAATRVLDVSVAQVPVLLIRRYS